MEYNFLVGYRTRLVGFIKGKRKGSFTENKKGTRQNQSISIFAIEAKFKGNLKQVLTKMAADLKKSIYKYPATSFTGMENT